MIDKKAIQDPFLDRRVKLLPCQKEMIIVCRENGMSLRALAKRFNVSTRLIQFTLHPERKERDMEVRKARGGSSIYYHKDYHRLKMREYRAHKAELNKFDGF